MGFRNERPDNWEELDALPRKHFYLGNKEIVIIGLLGGSFSIQVHGEVGVCADMIPKMDIFLIKKKIRSLIRIFK